MPLLNTPAASTATPRARHSGNSEAAAESSSSVYRPATSTQSRSQRATNHSATDAELTPTPIAPTVPSARSRARAG